MKFPIHQLHQYLKYAKYATLSLLGASMTSALYFRPVFDKDAAEYAVRFGNNYFASLDASVANDTNEAPVGEDHDLGDCHPNSEEEEKREKRELLRGPNRSMEPFCSSSLPHMRHLDHLDQHEIDRSSLRRDRGLSPVNATSSSSIEATSSTTSSATALPWSTSPPLASPLEETNSNAISNALTNQLNPLTQLLNQLSHQLLVSLSLQLLTLARTLSIASTTLAIRAFMNSYGQLDIVQDENYEAFLRAVLDRNEGNQGHEGSQGNQGNQVPDNSGNATNLVNVVNAVNVVGGGRLPNQGLLTISNHRSLFDDPGIVSCLLPLFDFDSYSEHSTTDSTNSTNRTNGTNSTNGASNHSNNSNNPNDSNSCKSSSLSSLFPSFPTLPSLPKLPKPIALLPQNNRWGICSQEYCFSPQIPPLIQESIHSYIGAGQVLPICRGAGIDQKLLFDFGTLLGRGEWCHVFPEGGVWQWEGTLGGRRLNRLNPTNPKNQPNQTNTTDPTNKTVPTTPTTPIIPVIPATLAQKSLPLHPSGKLKWGVGKLVAHAPVPPKVIPFAHVGMEALLPQDELTGKTRVREDFWKSVGVRVWDGVSYLNNLVRGKDTNNSIEKRNEPHGEDGENGEDGRLRVKVQFGKEIVFDDLIREHEEKYGTLWKYPLGEGHVGQVGNETNETDPSNNNHRRNGQHGQDGQDGKDGQEGQDFHHYWDSTPEEKELYHKITMRMEIALEQLTKEVYEGFVRDRDDSHNGGRR